jgi:tetratricopeptide (TPR) repeat protein
VRKKRCAKKTPCEKDEKNKTTHLSSPIFRLIRERYSFHFFYQKMRISLYFSSLLLVFAPVCLLAQADAKNKNNKTTVQDEAAVQKMYTAALDAYNAHDLKTAEKGFDKVLVANPNNWHAYINRGQIHLMNKQNGKAVADFAAAKKIRPKDATIPYDIGVIEGNNARFEEAVASFTAAIALDSTYAKAYSNRAEMYRMQRNYTAAKADLAKAKRLDKSLPAVYFTTAQLLLDEKKYKQAKLQLDTICLAFPAQMQPYMLRGLAFFELKQYKEAATDFSKVLFLDQRYAPAYIARGKARVALGLEEAACDDFGRAADLRHPDAGEFMRDFCNN